MKIGVTIPKEINGFLNDNDPNNQKIDNELWKFVIEINKFLYLLYRDDNLCINNEEKKYFFMIAAETHKTFQSILILSRKGLEEDAFTLLRRMYELLFKLRAIYNDVSNIQEIKNDAIYEYNEFYKKRQKNFPGMEGYKLPYIDKEVKRKNSIYNWAQKADSVDLYNWEYAILSQYTHASFEAINSSSIQYEQCINLEYIPSFNNSRLLLTEAAFIILESASILANKLDLSENNVMIIDRKKIELKSFFKENECFCGKMNREK